MGSGAGATTAFAFNAFANAVTASLGIISARLCTVRLYCCCAQRRWTRCRSRYRLCCRTSKGTRLTGRTSSIRVCPRENTPQSSTQCPRRSKTLRVYLVQTHFYIHLSAQPNKRACKFKLHNAKYYFAKRNIFTESN